MFPMPFEMIGQKSKSYISQELEKVHPGFSNTSVFDSHYRLKNGKLFASVVVMDQLVMEKYKGGKRSGLFFEGLNGKSFSDQNKTTAVFSIVLFLICAVLAILALTSVLKFRAQKTEVKNPGPGAEYFFVEESVEEEIGFDVVNGLSSFFDCVYFQAGKIGSLKMSHNGIQCNVQNCFPEKILELKKDVWLEQMDFQTGTVSYLNGTTSFQLQISLPFKENLEKQEDVVESGVQVNRAAIMEQARTCVLTRGADVVSENLMQKEMSFSVDRENCERVFIGLADFFRKENLEVNELQLVAAGNSIQMDLSWEETDDGIMNDMNEENVFNVFERNACLFFSDAIQEMDTMEDVAPVTAHEDSAELVTAEIAAARTGVLLGKIKNRNGEIFCYYRDSDGKIFQIQESN